MVLLSLPRKLCHQSNIVPMSCLAIACVYLLTRRLILPRDQTDFASTADSAKDTNSWSTTVSVRVARGRPPTTSTSTSRPNSANGNHGNDAVHSIPGTANNLTDGHKMAVLVPFRNCQTELKQFAPHISKYLHDKGIHHRIYILNQVDDFRFNRAALVNVGFREMHSDCDYIAMHDVDHLAQGPSVNYDYPRLGPRHLPRRHYTGYIGGVLLMTNGQFIQVNGLSNDFWGWGKEDDDLYKRLRITKIKVFHADAPFLTIHNITKRPKDIAAYFNQNKWKDVLDMECGVKTVEYSIDSRIDTTVNGAPVTFVNIRLKCNLERTPFCLNKKDHYKYIRTLSTSKVK